MTVTALPRTQILVRGSHAWRITKHNDRSFVAINNSGVTHRYQNERDCDRFWNFLESVGFTLRQEGWSLSSVVKHDADAPLPQEEIVAY